MDVDGTLTDGKIYISNDINHDNNKTWYKLK